MRRVEKKKKKKKGAASQIAQRGNCRFGMFYPVKFMEITGL